MVFVRYLYRYNRRKQECVVRSSVTLNFWVDVYKKFRENFSFNLRAFNDSVFLFIKVNINCRANYSLSTKKFCLELFIKLFYDKIEDES